VYFYLNQYFVLVCGSEPGPGSRKLIVDVTSIICYDFEG
jgi:hypothetical protein